MNETEYNEIDAIRATQLKALATGGDLALWAATFGEKADTAAMRFGRLCHACALLSDADLDAAFVLSPFADFRTKEAREWKAAQIEKGADICTEAEMQTARSVSDAFKLAAEREDADGWSSNDTEVSAVAEIAGGVKIKARADLLSTDRSILFDLKTTSSVMEAENQFWRLRYDIQAGLYALAFPAVREAKFIFVETSAPFRVAVISLTGEDLEEAKRTAQAYAIRAADLLKRNGSDRSAYAAEVANVETHRPLWIVDRFLDGV
jgi:hypothetical protein